MHFQVYIFLPLIPGYAGEYGRSSGVLLHTITHYNNTSINGLIKKLADSSIDALNYIFFFGLRTWSELNNSLITELIYVHSKLYTACSWPKSICNIESATSGLQHVTNLAEKSPCHLTLGHSQWPNFWRSLFMLLNTNSSRDLSCQI